VILICRLQRLAIAWCVVKISSLHKSLDSDLTFVIIRVLDFRTIFGGVKSAFTPHHSFY
jgi:hypothetical protein